MALFMVLYATRCTFPAVDATALAAEVKQVSGVTLAVIVLGLALGMAGLLVGAARSSYVALLVLLALCTFLVAGVAGRTRAPGLGLLGLSAVALALTQAGDFVRGVRLFLPTAALAYLGGVVLWRTSPLGLLPEPHLTILALGVWLVAVLHRAWSHLTERAEIGWPRAMLRAGRDLLLLALLFAAARAMLLNGPALASRLFGASPPLAPMRHAVALAALAAAVHHLLSWLSGRDRICPRRLFTGCFLLALLFLLEMGRLLGASGLLHAVSESLAYATTSLWMLWYLVAVGIAFKLLKETRTVVDALEIVAPGRFLAAVSLLLLVAGLMLAFGSMLIDVGFAGWLPSALSLRLARFGLWVEKLPITLYQSLVAFRPVVVGALAWLLYLALRRKLDRTRMLTATFVTLLAWFAIYEYHFELFAFARVNAGAPRTDGGAVPVRAVAAVAGLQRRHADGPGRQPAISQGGAHRAVRRAAGAGGLVAAPAGRGQTEGPGGPDVPRVLLRPGQHRSALLPLRLSPAPLPQEPAAGAPHRAGLPARGRGPAARVAIRQARGLGLQPRRPVAHGAPHPPADHRHRSVPRRRALPVRLEPAGPAGGA